MKVSEFVKEWSGYGNVYRIYVDSDGYVLFRVKNKTWSVEKDTIDYAIGADFNRWVVRDMKDWIEKASGKPLWQALRDGFPGGAA